MFSAKQIAAYMLIAGGSFLLFLGTRDFLESRFGQDQAARDFVETPVPIRPLPGTRAAAEPRPRIGEAIAKLVIPRLDAQLYVIEGDGAEELRRGPGHLSETVLPGGKGNCVIAGHRDTHFRVLKDVRPGDDIVLETRTGEYLYRVKNTKIVSPSNVSALQPTPSAELNLVTCYPFFYVGSAPKRFVVEAQLAGSVAPPAS